MSGTYQHQWLSVIAPLIGATIAVILWGLTRNEERETDETNNLQQRLGQQAKFTKFQFPDLLGSLFGKQIDTE